jgi:hypothetical protein
MIAIIYNGDIRFNQDIAKENHQRLIDRLKEFGEVTTYNFTKNDPDRPACPYDEGGLDTAEQGTYRRAAGGAVQVWDFVQSVERTVEPIVIRMRTDTWFTDDSIEIIIKELQDIIDKKSGIYFFGSDLINDNAGVPYKKTYFYYVQTGDIVPNTVQDFIIIGRRECIVGLKDLNEKFSSLRGNKLRSGNKLFRQMVTRGAVAATIICNIFLIRKYFDLYPTDLEVYWEYVNSYVSAGKPEHMKPALDYYEKWKDSTL